MVASSCCRRSGQACRPNRQIFALLIALLVLSLAAATEIPAALAAEQGSKAASNKAIVLKYLEEVTQNWKMDAIDACCQPDVLLQLQSNWHSPVSGTNQVRGNDNLKKHQEMVHSIWEKKAEWLKNSIEDVIAEGDTVAGRGSRVYKDRESKEVLTRTAMMFFKLKEGKIAEMYQLIAGPLDPSESK